MKHKLLKHSLVATLLLISLPSLSQSLNPVVIGTVHAGDSVVIYYDVTIANPLPAGTTQISNQGNISGTGFTAFVTDDPATAAANDPTITPLNMFPLPVVLGQFKAYKKGDDIELAWKALTEINVSKYDVERSADGMQFTKTGEVTARNGTGSHDYTYLDRRPLINRNYYRLRMVDWDGKVKYSLVVLVHLGTTEQSLLVYPNPVRQKTLTLQLNNIPNGKFRLEMRNAQGQLVLQDEIIHNGGSATLTTNLPQFVTKGIYVLRLKSDEHTFNYKLLVE